MSENCSFDYLNHEVVKNNHDSGNTKVVMGFFNGLYWVVPNPDKPTKFDPVNEAYKKGHFTQKTTYRYRYLRILSPGIAEWYNMTKK